ncbi:MAG: type II toxin-antitoxin system RelB/DinJ family antitoxin [Clostridia bacterium]|nr:type II toxin-antitoxin system RelB/DinJ family antitoxin [Clostridia bacterium]
MPRKATRTASVYTCVDPETKEQAELILAELGIPMSNAVGMFLKQVVIQRGIPFEMKLSSASPLVIGDLSREQFNAEMQAGLDDLQAGRVASADDIETKTNEG